MRTPPTPWITLLLSVLIAGACIAAPVKVAEIEVSGNEIIAEETIRKAFPAGLLVGRFVDDLAGILATTRTQVMRLGYFKDVRVTAEEGADGQRVRVQVTELPRIENVIFKGNTLLSEEQLRNIVRTVPGAFLDDTLVRRDLQRIVEAYEDIGAAADAVYAFLEDEKTVLFGVLEAVFGGITFQGLKVVTEAEARRELGLELESVVTVASIQDGMSRLRETGWFASLDYQTRLERPGVQPPKLFLDVRVTEAPGIFPDRIGKLKPGVTAQQVRAIVRPPQVEIGFAVELKWDSAPPQLQSPDKPLEELRRDAEAETAGVAQIRAYARALEAAGERDAAAAQFNRAAERARAVVEAAPGDVRVRVALVFALRDAGMGEEALAEARRCVEQAPEDWQAQLALTTTAADRILKLPRVGAEADAGQARRAGLRATAQIMPWPGTRQAALAAVGAQADDEESALVEDAARALEKAQSLAPGEKLPAICVLDRVQRVMAALARAGVAPPELWAAFDKDRAERLPALRVPAESDPEMAVFVALIANARAVIAMLSGSQGDPATPVEMKALMDELTAIATKWPQSLRTSGGILGMAHLMSGDFDKARAIFEEMIQQNPDEREPYNALMAVAFSARDWEALAAAVRRRLERSQDAIDYVILGKTAMLLGKDDEALGHFEKAAELFPDDPLGHNAKAGWLVHLGRDDALATRHVDRALELAPDSGYAHALKAALALIANKPEDAVVRLTSALKSAPTCELANALRDNLFTVETVEGE
ncbi:MAG: hypothetical protein HPY44_15200 [Armatimonadetes bacterium]|nr:hypothetical protein [Armatimonadota bacterium]